MRPSEKATFTANYLPFYLPIPAITDDPAGGVLWSLCFNENWAPAILGALKALARPEIWKGTDSDVAAAVQSGHDILSQIQEWCGVNPIGTIFAHALSSAPANSLACDGSTYLRVDYPTLYSLLASAFITDADHFTVPDLRGRTLVGTGTGPGLTARAMNASGGEETHILVTAEVPAHTHTVTVPVAGPVGAPGTAAFPIVSSGTPTTSSSGGGGAHQNMQPWRALSYAIVAK